jgi:hypothetical protein
MLYIDRMSLTDNSGACLLLWGVNAHTALFGATTRGSAARSGMVDRTHAIRARGGVGRGSGRGPTVHPAATSCLDDSSPMPEFAPVMRTVLPTPSYVSCSPRLMAEARGITTPPRPARRWTASRAPSSVDARSVERPRRPRSRTLGAAYERLERRR